ncbi:MAG TPA: hypothetical protein VK689_08955 [Armatimonadota bacterium]|nr:hypothetical protein [Armatimonadota bacterium]
MPVLPEDQKPPPLPFWMTTLLCIVTVTALVAAVLGTCGRITG